MKKTIITVILAVFTLQLFSQIGSAERQIRGFAFDYYGGYSFLTGNLYNNYDTCVIGGIAFEYYHNKFEIILKIYGGAIGITNDMKYSKGFYPLFA